jgi:hypothetical protein
VCVCVVTEVLTSLILMMGMEWVSKTFIDVADSPDAVY